VSVDSCRVCGAWRSATARQSPEGSPVQLEGDKDTYQQGEACTGHAVSQRKAGTRTQIPNGQTTDRSRYTQSRKIEDSDGHRDSSKYRQTEVQTGKSRQTQSSETMGADTLSDTDKERSPRDPVHSWALCLATPVHLSFPGQLRPTGRQCKTREWTCSGGNWQG
jgi:hypothetical protein